MKLKFTLNGLVAGMQTVFICLALYAGEKGIMGYAAEKMACAVIFSLLGIYLTKRRVCLNKKFKGLMLMTGILLGVIVHSYFRSYSPTTTYPYLLRFVFVFLFSCICFDINYLEKLCRYLQNFGVIIAVIYVITWPIMGQNAGIYMDYQYTGQITSFATAFTIPNLFSRTHNLKKEIGKLFIILFALMITGKRTLFVIPILMIMVVLVLSDDYAKYRKIFLMGIIAIVGIAIVNFTIPSAMNSVIRLLNTKTDTTMSYRKYFWAYAIMLWSKNKMYGIGFGCFPEHIATGGVDLSKYRYIKAWSAHNIYYQMLAEIGTVGTIIFCTVFIIAIVYTLYWLKKSQKAELAIYSKIAMVSLYCQLWFLLYGVTGNPLYLPGQLFSEFFGLILISSIRNGWDKSILQNK